MIADKESLKEEVTEALRTVIDPEIGLNVVELGLIRKLDIGDEQDVQVTMILTTPFCPYGPQLIDQVRRTASNVTGAAATVELGTELWDPSMMEEGAGGDWGLF